MNTCPISQSVTSANMVVTLVHFLSFFQNEGKSVKKGKNHHKYGHVPPSKGVFIPVVWLMWSESADELRVIWIFPLVPICLTQAKIQNASAKAV